MSHHESLRAAGPKDLAGIIQYLGDGGLPDTRWSMNDLEIPKGYVSTWPHWNTPLHRMIVTKQRDGVEYLLDHNASVDFCNSLGRTPLQEATRLGYYEEVELLLGRGADPNMTSAGQTVGLKQWIHIDPESEKEYVLPIHEAIRNSDTRMIRILAHAGADINKPSSEGWLPLDLALIDRQTNVMAALVEVGANFSCVKQTINCEPDQRKEAAQALLFAASHSGWFPPPGCHLVFIHVLAVCNAIDHIGVGPDEKKIIHSERLIRSFFKTVSSIAQRLNIEPDVDSLCSRCFEYQLLATYDQCSCLNEGASPTLEKCFRHHEGMDGLVLSAESGCRFCRIILQAFNAVKSYRHPMASTVTKYRNLSTCHVYLHLKLPRRLYVTVHDNAAELEFDYLNEITIKQSPSIDDYEKGTASASSFHVAKVWLQNCITSHETCCQTPASTALPTRVVDVGNESQDPFLFESKGAHHRYCALSYCWGTSSNAHRTTKEKLQRYSLAIPICELPLTLRDAIHVARNMGFKYIWIDALCIIQDDDDDWAREATKMHQVYANATLTITTSIGSSSNDGLFRSHPHGFFNPQQLHLRLPKRDRFRETPILRDSGLSVVRPIHPLSYLAIYPIPNHLSTGAVGGPIESRAWVLQEQILSKRILYYGDGILLWECMDITASEHDPDGRRGFVQFPDRLRTKLYFHSHMTAQLPKTSSTIVSEASDSEPPVADELLATYGRVLTTYANRLVTKTSDRLTAVLGLCQVLQEISGNEFIGGIWKGNYTLASLLWCLDTPSPNERIRRFPSWSWASILSHPLSQFVYEIGEETTVPNWEAEVVSFDVQSDLAQTEVKGSITLKGRLGRVKKDENYMGSLEGLLRKMPYARIDLGSYQDIVGVDLDDVWYIEVATSSGESNLIYKVGLILRQVYDRDNLTFERIGAYRDIAKDENTEIQTIVLV
ncbi:HET-domain-containing protein [Xylariaceae sp. AK1471]|nr:HET-domain-containing protein [Xylariaceae sp. AK1471]